MILIFWVLQAVVLLSSFANAQQNSSNSTFHSSIVKLNINSSLTAISDNKFDECNSLSVTYFHSLSSFYASLRSASTIEDSNLLIRTISEVKTAFDYSSLIYTLDDGYPRLSLIPTATYLSTSVDTIYPAFTKLPPDCSKLLHIDCGRCTIKAVDVQVNYWPDKTVPSHPNATITSNDAEHVTAVIDGFTFTSPTAYLSFDFIWTSNACGLGYIHSGSLLAMSAAELSTVEFYEGGPTSRSMNFEDLIDPIPARAYFGQPGCSPNFNVCLPIRPDDYEPYLAIPSEIKTLNSGWEDCDLDMSFDPPRILEPAQALAGPTSEPNADPSSPTFHSFHPQASFRPLGPVRTEDLSIAFSPSAVPNTPLKNGDPSIEDPSSNNPDAPESPAKSPSANNSPANNSPGTNGLTQDPSDSGDSNSGREAAIITVGSQIYTVNANSHFVIGSETLSVGGPAAIVSGQTVSLNTEGIIVGDTMHPFSAVSSAIQSNLDPAEAMLYTGPSSKKVIVIGSSTLSAGGAAGNVGGQTLSVGANGIILGSQTIDFSAFETSKPHSGRLIVDGKSLSLAGIHALTSPGKLHPPGFPAASPTLRHVLPTVVIVSAETISVDPAGQYLDDGKTFTLDDPYPKGADLATMISSQLVASAAQASPPTTVRAQPPSSSSPPAGVGQRIFDAFNGGGGGTGESGGEGKEDGTRTSGSAAGNSTQTGAGVVPYTGRAAERVHCNYVGWFTAAVITAWLGEMR